MRIFYSYQFLVTGCLLLPTAYCQLATSSYLLRNFPFSNFSITSSFSLRLMGMWWLPMRISLPSMLLIFGAETMYDLCVLIKRSVGKYSSTDLKVRYVMYFL